MRVALATVRTSSGVLPLTDAQRSHWRSPGSVFAESITALNMAKEAGETTVNYIARFGRLPWLEHRALLKLNISADALYIEHCGHTV
jgi:hypothetical protein